MMTHNVPVKVNPGMLQHCVIYLTDNLHDNMMTHNVPVKVNPGMLQHCVIYLTDNLVSLQFVFINMMVYYQDLFLNIPLIFILNKLILHN